MAGGRAGGDENVIHKNCSSGTFHISLGVTSALIFCLELRKACAPNNGKAPGAGQSAAPSHGGNTEGSGRGWGEAVAHSRMPRPQGRSFQEEGTKVSRMGED